MLHANWDFLTCQSGIQPVTGGCAGQGPLRVYAHPASFSSGASRQLEGRGRQVRATPDHFTRSGYAGPGKVGAGCTTVLWLFWVSRSVRIARIGNYGGRGPCTTACSQAGHARGAARWWTFGPGTKLAHGERYGSVTSLAPENLHVLILASSSGTPIPAAQAQHSCNLTNSVGPSLH